jgi:regulator of protease activity HflC (stomatin/prohibitin superfamily)
MLKEREAGTLPGGVATFGLIAGIVGSVWWMFSSGVHAEPWGIVAGTLLLIFFSICFAGLFIVNPNEAKVVTLFGEYAGSARKPGLWWVHPLSIRRRVSMRIRNFESAKLKVNDHDGNPIEIAAVVVWKVVDSAEALFEVDSYENFVHVQCEAALRNLATTYAYDAHQDGQLSLRANISEVAEQLRVEIEARLQKAGVHVIESRISHLAYAPEIASAMLRRQQASAIVAARTKIVEGAVGMVEMALDMLSRNQVVTLDEERRASMVSNLLVVLCSEHNVQPVVNTGTLYS